MAKFSYAIDTETGMATMCKNGEPMRVHECTMGHYMTMDQDGKSKTRGYMSYSNSDEDGMSVTKSISFDLGTTPDYANPPIAAHNLPKAVGQIVEQSEAANALSAIMSDQIKSKS